MKRPKDRLHRVTVIGATPAGIAATNKLGELGIPVTLVDSDFDLDQKLARKEWRLESGVALNYAHKPGLIRILRNPEIQCILPADIISIKHSPQGFRIKMRQVQTYIDPGRCSLCGRCVDICPVINDEGEKAIRITSRQSLPGHPVIDKRRQPLCQENCPLGVNAQGYIALTRAGRYPEALNLIRKDNVLPAICGRICTHPCEAACRRGDLDAPVSIRDIKRFVADQDYPQSEPKKEAFTGKKGREKHGETVAVIGSGPSGLAAAADLARNGYPVTIFEKEKMPGGLLRYGIGPHRLPREVLDEEVEYIEKLGVTIKTDHPVDLDKKFTKLLNAFRAVILATGTWSDRFLGVPGEDLKGVEGCLAFLSGLYRNGKTVLREKVAVIGDGNTAFDLARALVRIGADVTLLSWFPKSLIPGDPEEVKAALEEGIKIEDCTQVVAFKGHRGKLDRIHCVRTEPGEPDDQGIPWPVKVQESKSFDFDFNRAFVAIGQKGSFTKDGKKHKVNITEKGTIETDEFCRTNLEGVYAAGDTATGPTSVVDAMADGRRVAQRVHLDICKSKGMDEVPDLRPLRPKDRDFSKIPEDIPFLARSIMPEQQPGRRKQTFTEVALGLSETQVMTEAERCLQCGVCSECLECVAACGEMGAINHAEHPREIIEHTGVVIIADPNFASRVKGEDVIRAYGPKAAKSDVYAMLTRGFASAASAMILLGRTSSRPKGHGVSFLTPDQGLSKEIRLGVFVCRCNDSMGWLDSMDDYIETLSTQTDIVHAEVINAACIPEGSSSILKAVREKGVTRVVLASCVCCPLNFVCSGCDDQRSRLKEALFRGTGISRSMVEACNLRGEVLRILKDDPALGFTRFKGLIDRSIKRAKKLKALPVLARNYNFTTAVIGRSESAENSVWTLAEAGFEVFWFGTPGEPMPISSPHPNIHSFEEAVVTQLSGTVGEFQISFDIDGTHQALQVGAVILGEKARRTVQYILQKGLPSFTVKSGGQKPGVAKIPFFYPGATSIPGLFVADSPGVYVSKRRKGAAVAVQAAAIMPRGPRQNKGLTVVVDGTLCRGCGRCINMCPYQAITLSMNEIQGWYASVDEALCKGCGNCISVCPSNAADSPYRNQAFLEETLEELLAD